MVTRLLASKQNIKMYLLCSPGYPLASYERMSLKKDDKTFNDLQSRVLEVAALSDS